jgi:hypothetical protein
MDTILGLLGMTIWIAGTIGLAAGITYVVMKLAIRFFPSDEDLKPKPQQ